MSHIEPSYLRYIYDGLEKGELHPDNAAALPEGLIGLYEAAFEENKPARERQKLLETFAIWALLKKEVSAQFVSEILDVPSQEIVDFIATYSSWFTSPESGKYQLYHERLKIYVLSKCSENIIIDILSRLVNSCLTKKSNQEFDFYRFEFLGDYLFIQLLMNNVEYLHFKKVLFKNKYIDGQFNTNPSGEAFYKNLKNAFFYSDYYKIDDRLFLNKIWYNSFNKAQKKKETAFNQFINEGKIGLLKDIFHNYSEYKELYEDLIYAILNVIKRNKYDLIISFSKEIVYYFPKDLKVFSWKFIPTLNERFLLELCFDLFSQNIDISFILNYGVFEINNVIDRYKTINNGLTDFDFYLKVLNHNVSSEKSNFYYLLFADLNSNERKNLAKKFDKIILEPYYKSKYLILLSDFKLGLCLKEIKKYWDEIDSLKKAEVFYQLYSNQKLKTLILEINALENNFLNIVKEIQHKKLNELLTEEESFLEKDHQTRKIMLVETTLVKLLNKLNHQQAIRLIAQVIKRSDEIKNGGVKGQAVIEVQQMLLGFNYDLEVIANKAYIPRVPLGGLSYGQYETGNLLDLSENNWNSNDYSKAYNLLLEAEGKVLNIDELTNREQVSLRMINLFLNHKKHLKARSVLKRLTISQIRFTAIEMIANYYVNNDNSKISSLLKESNSKSEQKLIIKFIFNYVKYIDIKEYKSLFVKYLKPVNSINLLKIEGNICEYHGYKQSPFKIDENKTLPPFFSLLYRGVKLECTESVFKELSSFQKLYFSKKKVIIDDILNIDDVQLHNLGQTYFNNLLRFVFEDDFNSFEKERININNKFNIVQLIHHISKKTKKPYLYINHIEKQIDSKLFYTSLESIEYNMRIVGLDNSNNEFASFIQSKVLKSWRLALLTQNLN